MSGPVAIDELRAAYRAVQEGVFRTVTVPVAQAAPAKTSPEGQAVWEPSGRVLLVAGCMGSAGASTIALALATSAGDARVVECCTVASSGLCGATSAELGTVNGWVSGRRDLVVIERRGDRIASLANMPIPAPSGKPITVLDSSFDIDVLAADDGWLGEVFRTAPLVVLVTRGTLPGLRRLDAAVELAGAERSVAVVIGVGKRWPKALAQALTPALRRLRTADRLVSVPTASVLALGGLTPDPLPTAVMAAAADIVNH